MEEVEKKWEVAGTRGRNKWKAAADLSAACQYTSVHANPQGPRDARPTAAQIVQDEKLVNRLIGRVIVITGATAGIGLETARALIITGATLFLTVRDLEKAKTTLHDLLMSDQVHLVKMDNFSISSVRDAADDILEKSNNQVNILIINAGVMGIPNLEQTEEGFESHFVTNYLSHFLYFQLLKPALLASATPEFSSRVVNVSSSAHRSVELSASDNYNFEKGNYDAGVAYAQSKLASIYMANEIDRRYGHRGLRATSLHPGAIGGTNISRNVSPEFVARVYETLKDIMHTMKSPEQGAATTLVAAIGKEWENKGGKYLEDCEEAKRGADDQNVFGIGWVRQTYNAENEARLWKDSLEMLGLKDDL
ncbi:short-chain dehydrogenase/reductase, putative [Talaromyces stipitatus ATCC 10500]|uniref:Short-chain dehydrogenase/reductase, putative n=1 Tax=Talaromyces stipitatus (strain ATCC 10500 / CBS 375.48 / QM 6759 / NRRL 1006) TaxID=441959 RepID=B8MIE0_TALSN|nr:short-chain dehydrogenase/reductase, putative [Talaromyces stipitatus ATCC 10500]EED14624.1 short-chain dehydrogenase/reductase, putative [Talaromyces stipitatus ATCC 10500]